MRGALDTILLKQLDLGVTWGMMSGSCGISLLFLCWKAQEKLVVLCWKKTKEKKLEHREVTKNFYLDQSVATLTNPTFLDFNFIFSLELFFLAYAFA